MSDRSTSPITKPAATKMANHKADATPAVLKISSPSPSSATDGEHAADPATVASALKIPISARDSKPDQEHIEEGLEETDLEDTVRTMLNKRATAPASDTSSLSSAPSSGDEDDEDDTEMVDAEGNDNEKDDSRFLTFAEKIAAATAKTKPAKEYTPRKKTTVKHRISSPEDGPEEKKARTTAAPKRDRCKEAAAEVQTLPYQSIISINMPDRVGIVAGQPIPEPDKDNLPFGDTEDYHNSMIIHYMDEVEMTYTKAADVYSAKFPRDAVTDEAIRKRHIRSLLRLKKKFGIRDVNAIPKPSNAVTRRGTPRAKKVAAIQPVGGVSFTDAAGPAAAADAATEDKGKKERRTISRRMLEKTLIVTWRDIDKLKWKEIQGKLEDEYKWSLGQGTIEKYYYLTLERVYGKGGKKVKSVEVREKKEAEGEEKEEVRTDGDFGGFVERIVERRMSF